MPEPEIELEDNWREHIGFLLDILIKQAEYLDWLNERLLTMQLNEVKIIKLLQSENTRWHFLLRNLKPLVETQEGMQNYLAEVSKRLVGLEDKTESKIKKYKYG